MRAADLTTSVPADDWTPRSPEDIWQVTIETETGGVIIHTFDNEREADEFATDYFTTMDTSEARDTLVAMTRKEQGA